MGEGQKLRQLRAAGPFLATTDEIQDPQKLSMWLSVNGKERQRGSTSTMIFGVAKLVADLSCYMTLEPGDLITTGTPPGVGMGQKPEPQYLKAGDTIGMREKSKTQLRVTDSLKLSQTVGQCDWVQVDPTKLEGVFKKVPDRDQFGAEIKEALIVELYSR